MSSETGRVILPFFPEQHKQETIMAWSLNLTATKGSWDQMFDAVKKTLTHTPVTKTVDNFTKAETLTDGAPVSIYGIFYKRDELVNQEQEVLFNGADAIVLLPTTSTVARDHKIAYDGDTFRVRDKVVTRYVQAQAFYKVARLFKI
jgi:hypothetical protein